MSTLLDPPETRRELAHLVDKLMQRKASILALLLSDTAPAPDATLVALLVTTDAAIAIVKRANGETS